MILQEEFKKSGYKDILVGDTASEYEIDLEDIFELNHKPEELLSIFISEQRDELFFFWMETWRRLIHYAIVGMIEFVCLRLLMENQKRFIN